ncbi:hypothetical protein N7472_005995 [Penicillium cf. griseofulvum]|uniref:Uncharacterized protein n=1 Tax=Penicillium cf. griseofulvum TaxID=2972120 RepID=A0A9W9MGD0_9EURO|nr:hypothetical protein N7472_005995 [Penicillium cf. griseofulvum]
MVSTAPHLPARDLMVIQSQRLCKWDGNYSHWTRRHVHKAVSNMSTTFSSSPFLTILLVS